MTLAAWTPRLALLAIAVIAGPLQADEASYDIAFLGTRAGQYGIHVMRGDGSHPTLLLADPNDLLLTPSSWSPDGKRIAILCRDGYDDLMKKYPAPMHFALCVVNADGSGRERVLDVPVELFFKWSPDSQRLAFSSGYEDSARDDPMVQQGRKTGSVAVYVLDLPSRKTTRLTSLGQNRFVSWSPDSRRIAFSGGDTDAPLLRDIYVVDADGKNRQPVTTAPTIDVQPKWSPRGDLITLRLPGPCRHRDRGPRHGRDRCRDPDRARKSWRPGAEGSSPPRP